MNDLTPGFASAFAAQACFRAILTAFSTPGHLVRLPADLTPPLGLSIASAALLLTLADAHTKIALPDDVSIQPWLRFHTGAPPSPQEEADFCVARRYPALSTLRQGTDETPEDSATLILDVETMDGPIFQLSGPGLAHPVEVALPLDEPFLLSWQAQTRNTPRGVDVILCAGDQILALPRSVRIEKG